MDYLIARITNQRHDNTRLLLSGITTFENVVIGASMPYNDERKLHEGEWFCVDEFSQKSYFNTTLFNDLENEITALISWEEYKKIKYIISIQDEGCSYHFQRVLPKYKIVQRKGLRFYNDRPEMIDVENMMTINQEPDAIYLKNDDRLLFKDLSRIRPIFNGIEILFREATNEEVDNFLSIDIVNLVGGFDRSKVGVPNRRRISNAITQYNAFTDVEKRTLHTYMTEYCPEIVDSASSRVQIGSDEHLKKFIYAIDQRYYLTPINNQKRVATSIENL